MLVLATSADINVISVVMEKTVEIEVHCYLLTFYHDKALTSSIVPFSFHHPSGLFPKSFFFFFLIL